MPKLPKFVITLLKVGIPLGGLVGGIVVLLIVVGILRAWWATPFEVFGLGEAPEQPIDFPHTVHVEQMGIQCEFCHREVARGDAATVPSVEQCLLCHKDIETDSGTMTHVGKGNTGVSILRDHWETENPINWTRVHRLPDHVQFKHEPHIRFFTGEQGLETQQVCTLCHGDVANMDTVEQVKDLKMGDCVDCHRDNNAPTDCVACHY